MSSVSKPCVHLSSLRVPLKVKVRCVSRPAFKLNRLLFDAKTQTPRLINRMTRYYARRSSLGLTCLRETSIFHHVAPQNLSSIYFYLADLSASLFMRSLRDVDSLSVMNAGNVWFKEVSVGRSELETREWTVFLTPRCPCSGEDGRIFGYFSPGLKDRVIIGSPRRPKLHSLQLMWPDFFHIDTCRIDGCWSPHQGGMKQLRAFVSILEESENRVSWKRGFDHTAAKVTTKNPALLKYTSECELIKYRCSVQRVCNVMTVSSGHEQLRLLSLVGGCLTCSLVYQTKVRILSFSRIWHHLIFQVF